MRYELLETSWGTFGYVARNDRLLATFLPQARRTVLRAIRNRHPGAHPGRNLLPKFRRQVIRFFDGHRTKFSVPLDLTDLPAFHRSVVQQCRRIPYGKTASYADLARATGNPHAARAVGNAMAKNPLPLVVPCHRVLRTDGSLGGFSTPRGLDEKIRLLRLENPTFELHTRDEMPSGNVSRRPRNTQSPTLHPPAMAKCA